MGRPARKPLDSGTVNEIIKNILDGWSISLAIRYATGRYDSSYQKWIMDNHPKVRQIYSAFRKIQVKTSKMSPANCQMNIEIQKKNQTRLAIGLDPLPLIDSYLKRG